MYNILCWYRWIAICIPFRAGRLLTRPRSRTAVMLVLILSVLYCAPRFLEFQPVYSNSSPPSANVSSSAFSAMPQSPSVNLSAMCGEESISGLRMATSLSISYDVIQNSTLLNLDKRTSVLSTVLPNLHLSSFLPLLHESTSVPDLPQTPNIATINTNHGQSGDWMWPLTWNCVNFTKTEIGAHPVYVYGYSLLLYMLMVFLGPVIVLTVLNVSLVRELRRLWSRWKSLSRRQRQQFRITKALISLKIVHKLITVVLTREQIEVVIEIVNNNHSKLVLSICWKQDQLQILSLDSGFHSSSYTTYVILHGPF